VGSRVNKPVEHPGKQVHEGSGGHTGGRWLDRLSGTQGGTCDGSLNLLA
jgi:hypothetical protein